MEAFVLIFVVIVALFAIASGIWVAIALVRAITRQKPYSQTDEQNSNLQEEPPEANPG
jgi:cytoskeletal protein RodZ